MRRFLLVIIAIFFIAPEWTAQTTVKKVVLQGFWWDYHNNNYSDKWANYLADLAPRLKAMGIDAVWIPPSIKNESPYYVGYSPFDQYDLGDKYQKGATNTRLGTKDELLRMIAIMHANGIEVIQDVVLNHNNSAGSANGSGGQDPNSYSMASNAGYKNFRYVSYNSPATDESQTNYWNRKGRWPKNYTNFYPNASNNCTTGDICSAYFGPDISYESTAYGISSNVLGFNPAQSSNYMRNGGRDWMMWMKKQTAVDGFRWDAVKHFPTYVQQDYSVNVKNVLPAWCKGGQNMFNVGEWVGSKTELDSYVNNVAGGGDKMMGAFDFGLRAFDANGGLYGMVYGMGNFNMANLPGAQQNERVSYYSSTNTYVHRTVPFVNNHDTFRPQLNASGNYSGWNSSQELSSHIEPNEPRLSAAYAAMLAMDGNPQIFFEDLFDIGYNGNRYNHDPKSSSSLPARSDLINLMWCHQVLDFKSGPYQVPHSSADYLIISRAGKAIIGVTDSWSNWQNQWVYTSFAAGTVLKDYSGANGNATVTVDGNGWAPINTPPVDPSSNIAGRRGYSVWAPIGKDGSSYIPPRDPSTTQEWEMADDLGDSHVWSLGQGGAIPASSTNFRTAGKIYVDQGKQVTYILYPQNATKSLYIGLYNNSGTLLSSKVGTGNLTGYYTPNFTGWITIKVRNNVASNPTQKCWVNVNYTAPQSILGTSSTSAENTASVWSANGKSSDWNDPYNWEEGKIPDSESHVIIPGNAFPHPAIVDEVIITDLIVEEDAHLFINGRLIVKNELNSAGEISGDGEMIHHYEPILLKSKSTAVYSVYPNPTDGPAFLSINGVYDEFEVMHLNVISPDGRLIQSISGSLQVLNETLVHAFDELSSGIYYLQIETKNPQVLKLVKN